MVCARYFLWSKRMFCLYFLVYLNKPALNGLFILLQAQRWIEVSFLYFSFQLNFILKSSNMVGSMSNILIDILQHRLCVFVYKTRSKTKAFIVNRKKKIF